MRSIQIILWSKVQVGTWYQVQEPYYYINTIISIILISRRSLKPTLLLVF